MCIRDRYDSRVSSFVADDGDLIGYVNRLESMADAGELDSGIDDPEDEDLTVNGGLAGEQFDGNNLMAELERFLRDQDSDG